MRKQPLPAIGLAGILLVAGGAPVLAEVVIVRGTTSIRSDKLIYLDSSGVTSQQRDNQKLRQYGVYSSLGGTDYSLYTVDFKAKQAFHSFGSLTSGYTLFPNVNDKGQDIEDHKQFNKLWTFDIPGEGGVDDIRHTKAGWLRGFRRAVNLREAGFSIVTAPKLSGSHVHTICSNLFAPDPNSPSGYASGRFNQVDSSRTSLKLDVKLTDLANQRGGSIIDGRFVMDTFLADKDITIIPADPLPF